MASSKINTTALSARNLAALEARETFTPSSAIQRSANRQQSQDMNGTPTPADKSPQVVLTNPGKRPSMEPLPLPPPVFASATRQSVSVLAGSAAAIDGMLMDLQSSKQYPYLSVDHVEGLIAKLEKLSSQFSNRKGFASSLLRHKPSSERYQFAKHKMDANERVQVSAVLRQAIVLAQSSGNPECIDPLVDLYLCIQHASMRVHSAKQKRKYHAEQGRAGMAIKIRKTVPLLFSRNATAQANRAPETHADRYGSNEDRPEYSQAYANLMGLLSGPDSEIPPAARLKVAAAVLDHFIGDENLLAPPHANPMRAALGLPQDGAAASNDGDGAAARLRQGLPAATSAKQHMQLIRFACEQAKAPMPAMLTSEEKSAEAAVVPPTPKRPGTPKVPLAAMAMQEPGTPRLPQVVEALKSEAVLEAMKALRIPAPAVPAPLHTERSPTREVLPLPPDLQALEQSLKSQDLPALTGSLESLEAPDLQALEQSLKSPKLQAAEGASGSLEPLEPGVQDVASGQDAQPGQQAGQGQRADHPGEQLSPTLQSLAASTVEQAPNAGAGQATPLPAAGTAEQPSAVWVMPDEQRLALDEARLRNLTRLTLRPHMQVADANSPARIVEVIRALDDAFDPEEAERVIDPAGAILRKPADLAMNSWSSSKTHINEEPAARRRLAELGLMTISATGSDANCQIDAMLGLIDIRDTRERTIAADVRAELTARLAKSGIALDPAEQLDLDGPHLAMLIDILNERYPHADFGVKIYTPSSAGVLRLTNPRALTGTTAAPRSNMLPLLRVRYHYEKIVAKRGHSPLARPDAAPGPALTFPLLRGARKFQGKPGGESALPGLAGKVAGKPVDGKAASAVTQLAEGKLDNAAGGMARGRAGNAAAGKAVSVAGSVAHAGASNAASRLADSATGSKPFRPTIAEVLAAAAPAIAITAPVRAASTSTASSASQPETEDLALQLHLAQEHDMMRLVSRSGVFVAEPASADPVLLPPTDLQAIGVEELDHRKDAAIAGTKTPAPNTRKIPNLAAKIAEFGELLDSPIGGNSLFHALHGKNLNRVEIFDIRKRVAKVRSDGKIKSHPSNNYIQVWEALRQTGGTRITKLREKLEAMEEKVLSDDAYAHYQAQPGIYAGDDELTQVTMLPEYRNKMVLVFDVTKRTVKLSEDGAIKTADVSENDARAFFRGERVAVEEEELNDMVRKADILLVKTKAHWQRIKKFAI